MIIIPESLHIMSSNEKKWLIISCKWTLIPIGLLDVSDLMS